MSTADLAIVALVVLADKAAVWSLFYSQRVLLAASPKPRPAQAGKPEAAAGDAAQDVPAPGLKPVKEAS